MNILLVTDDFYPRFGGISHTLRCLCLFIRKTPHNLYIFNPFYKGQNIFDTLDFKRDPSILEIFNFFRSWKNLNFTYRLIKKTFSLKKLKFSKRVNLILYLFLKPKLFYKIIKNLEIIKEILKGRKIDLVLTSHSGPILPLGYFLSQIFNTKLFSMAHGTDIIIRTPFSLRSIFFEEVDLFLTSNIYIQKLLYNIYGLENSVVINRGIIKDELEVNYTKAQLREKYQIPSDSFVLFSVGRHIRRKNFSLAIRAVGEIRKLRPDLNIRLYLIGSGPRTHYLKNLTKNLDLEDQIYFLGEVKQKIRNHYYKLSDLFLMPAISTGYNIEGFGIVFLEANYFKLPAIGTRSGGMRKAILDGVTGFLIEPDNLEQFTKKILLLADNITLRKKMGQTGKQRVIKEYTWDNLINRYVRIFEKCG